MGQLGLFDLRILAIFQNERVYEGNAYLLNALYPMPGLSPPQLGIHLGSGIIAAIINATISALILLLIIKLVRGGGWRGSRGETYGAVSGVKVF